MYFNLIKIILGLFDNQNKKKITNFFKKNTNKKISVFIDVGAHHGETVKLFKKNFEVGEIYAFEPSPKNYKNLVEKTKNITNLEIFNIAIGKESGMIEFKQHFESQSSTITEINLKSNYYKRKNRYLDFFGIRQNKFTRLEVKIDRLDNILEHKNLERIDILKIDTEGYDLNVIYGLGELIKKVKYIYFEHHFHNMLVKEYTLSDVHNYMIKNNFEKKLKLKMKFRKTFEYIYLNKSFKN